MEEHRFVLYEQRILPLAPDLQGGEHHELLLRMRETDGTIIPPMAFIPAAERYALMPAIDRWVIREALSQCAARKRMDMPDGTYAINLSGASICDEQMLDFVREQFAHYQVAPEKICFEITETVAIANLTQAGTMIRALKEMGCRIALDDFGSGMSSFTYLKNLNVDYLKIDGSFVKNMVANPVDFAMVEAINRIGHVMGIQTIAEYVEDEKTLQALRQLGVDFAQGFNVGKPYPAGCGTQTSGKTEERRSKPSKVESAKATWKKDAVTGSVE
jgi:EAL domain-containing protein (putative c-di-GMP-specific phosphodiesterase class I)